MYVWFQSNIMIGWCKLINMYGGKLIGMFIKNCDVMSGRCII